METNFEIKFSKFDFRIFFSFISHLFYTKTTNLIYDFQHRLVLSKI